MDYKRQSEQFGISFEDTVEGDDEIKIAFLETTSGRQFVLYTYYEGAAFENTTLINGGIDAPGTGDELEDYLKALNLDRNEVNWHRDWRLDAEEFKPKWRLWRQDDNGNRMVIDVFSSEQDAEKKREEFDAKGHKQIYWVEKVN